MRWTASSRIKSITAHDKRDNVRLTDEENGNETDGSQRVSLASLRHYIRLYEWART